MQKRIANFLLKKYTCTLAASDGNRPWAFACYYAFDSEAFRLIYVTGLHTTHAKLMKKNPYVSGTIFTPTRFHASLQGTQFQGVAQQLTGEDEIIAREIYRKEYQHTLIDSLSVWEVRLERVRLIDNSLGLFGSMEWNRDEQVEEELPPLT